VRAPIASMRAPRPAARCRQVLGMYISLGMFGSFAILGTLTLTNGRTAESFCTFCHHISCVPVPLWRCEAGMLAGIPSTTPVESSGNSESSLPFGAPAP
jgi:hypothetical protein